MIIFQITLEDVERSSLEVSDVGKWGYLVSGCYQLFDSLVEATISYNSAFNSAASCE